jgi:hypothetical protein
VPDRGQPTMKNGSGGAAPAPRFSAEPTGAAWR